MFSVCEQISECLMQRKILAAVQTTDEWLIALPHRIQIFGCPAVTSLDCMVGVVTLQIQIAASPCACKNELQHTVHYGTFSLATLPYLMFVNYVIVT